MPARIRRTLIVGLEFDAATALAGHANPLVPMRVYADDLRRASERNAAVLAFARVRSKHRFPGVLINQANASEPERTPNLAILATTRSEPRRI
jgi:hypothetical protein